MMPMIKVAEYSMGRKDSKTLTITSSSPPPSSFLSSSLLSSSNPPKSRSCCMERQMGLNWAYIFTDLESSEERAKSLRVILIFRAMVKLVPVAVVTEAAEASVVAVAEAVV